MLEDVDVDAGTKGASRKQLLHAVRSKGIFDRLHVLGLWALAADVNSGTFSTAELEASRSGELLWMVEERRRHRDGAHGEILPLWRGGPVS